MNLFTIIYAHRNKDLKRIKNSLDSLRRQALKNFEVIFIDYGSVPVLALEIEKDLSQYDFVRYFSLDVSQLLWNKSKALNYGIKKVNTPYVFISDVDIIFHPLALNLFQTILKVKRKFFLFELSYLSDAETEKLNAKGISFEKLRTHRTSSVNGMILIELEGLLKINGLDEFFHFYGSEDEDLFARLENAGYKREFSAAGYFYHQWHKSFSGSEDKLLTETPRVKNIMRLNQRHYLRNKERKLIKPLKQQGMGNFINKEESIKLLNPTSVIHISNIKAHIEHFLREELPTLGGEVVKVVFYESKYYRSLKYRIKKLLRKESQIYCSMKEVNDLILKEILFNYRSENYSYTISKEFKTITFSILL